MGRSNRDRNRSNQKTDPKTPKKNQSNIVSAQVGPFLEKAGSWGGGLAFIGSVVGWIFSQLIWTGLVAFAFLPFVVFAICRKLNWSKRPQAVSVSIAVGVSICGGLWLWSNRPVKIEREQISVICRTAFVSPSKEQATHALLHLVPDSHQQALSPIPVLLYVQFVNQQGTSLMINSYSLQAKTNGGQWFDVAQIDVRNGTVFWVAMGFDKAKGFLFHDFTSAVENKNITPGETVPGWLFADTDFVGHIEKWRMNLTMTTGKNTSAEFFSTNSAFDGLQVQAAQLKALNTEDLSKVTRIPYHEVIPTGVPVQRVTPKQSN